MTPPAEISEQVHVQLEKSWKDLLLPEFHKPYMKNLRQFLKDQIEQKKVLYPNGKDIFAAFNQTPFDQVKVVIIGQDPYHGPHQAHGMCFSVRPEIPPPPSLQNIFKELKSDLEIPLSGHGYLLSWAQQGVLLLNSILTVEAGKPLSHQNQGWEIFTDKIVELLNEKREHLIFVLWGSPAQRKGEKVNRQKHLVLTAPHPSPLSAYRGFMGCRHFSQINQDLIKHQQKPIDWSLPQ